MKAELVRWSCDCKGIHFPDHTEDMIIWDCRGDDDDDSPYFSSHYREKEWMPLAPPEAIKMLRRLSRLSSEGACFLKIKTLWGTL